jgi:vacuolar protein sorting-associated protein 29
VTHGSLRIGFMEGFTVVAPTEADLLLAEANKLDVDVLCWGGTHRFDAYEYGDKFFVNPGSATGAFHTGWAAEGEEVVPSFCLMDVSILLYQFVYLIFPILKPHSRYKGSL